MISSLEPVTVLCQYMFIYKAMLVNKQGVGKQAYDLLRRSSLWMKSHNLSRLSMRISSAFFHFYDIFFSIGLIVSGYCSLWTLATTGSSSGVPTIDIGCMGKHSISMVPTLPSPRCQHRAFTRDYIYNEQFI